MEALNFRLAEEKNFHSEVLLFAFNPEHDIIVICSANGDVKRVPLASWTMPLSLRLSRSSPIRRTYGKCGPWAREVNAENLSV